MAVWGGAAYGLSGAPPRVSRPSRGGWGAPLAWQGGQRADVCNRCIVVDLSCNCEACSLDAPGVVTPDTAPDISEPN